MANYGEYSGAPSEQQTYDYARTILSLMTRQRHPDGKVLIIGGGIANFTNVAATFKGIKQALEEFQSSIREHGIKIFVRRAGPNYQEGLRVMREVGQNLGIPLSVFGPETHMTAIVGMALGKREVPSAAPSASSTASFMLPGAVSLISVTMFRVPVRKIGQCFLFPSPPISLELDRSHPGCKRDRHDDGNWCLFAALCLLFSS